jgi:hypothetical protein
VSEQTPLARLFELHDKAMTAAEFKGQAVGEWRAGQGSLDRIAAEEQKQLAADRAFDDHLAKYALVEVETEAAS